MTSEDVVDDRRSTTLAPRRTAPADLDSRAPGTSLFLNSGNLGRLAILNYVVIGICDAHADGTSRPGGVARNPIPSLSALLPPVNVRAVTRYAIDTLAVQDEVLVVLGIAATSVDGGPAAISLRSSESAGPVLSPTVISVRHLDRP